MLMSHGNYGSGALSKAATGTRGRKSFPEYLDLPKLKIVPKSNDFDLLFCVC